MPNHPVQFPEADFSRQKKNLLFFIGVALAMMAIMTALDHLLTNLSISERHYGIVSYELAWNRENVNKIFSSWGSKGKSLASFSLGLDFLFIVAYAAAIRQFCLVLSYCLYETQPRLSKAGDIFSILVIVAAGFDVVENSFLTAILLSVPSDSMVLSASLAASGKFALITVCLIYVFIGIITVMINKSCGPPNPLK